MTSVQPEEMPVRSAYRPKLSPRQFQESRTESPQQTPLRPMHATAEVAAIDDLLRFLTKGKDKPHYVGGLLVGREPTGSTWVRQMTEDEKTGALYFRKDDKNVTITSNVDWLAPLVSTARGNGYRVPNEIAPLLRNPELGIKYLR